MGEVEEEEEVVAWVQQVEDEKEVDVDDDLKELLDEIGLGVLYGTDIQQLLHKPEALSYPAPMERLNLGLGRQPNLINEQGGGNVLPMDQGFLYLFRNLGEGSEDATLLAWYIRTQLPEMELNNVELRNLVRRYTVNEFSSIILPQPSNELVNGLRVQFGIDLEPWVVENDGKKIQELRKKRKTSIPSHDDKNMGTKAHRTPKYKCRICAENKVDLQSRPHCCRPTFNQVVAEVKRRYNLLSRGNASASRPSPSSDGSGPRGHYMCGRCRKAKKRDNHDCVPDEYGLIASRVWKKFIGKKVSGEETDRLIHHEVKSRSSFSVDKVARRPLEQKIALPDIDIPAQNEDWRGDDGVDDAGLQSNKSQPSMNPEQEGPHPEIPSPNVQEVHCVRQPGRMHDDTFHGGDPGIASYSDEYEEV
mmetsp:Transcript_23541/g.67000  ORF Transcript_23541/g.67000 Transcript_23541/m.67000 type:complete len:418 (+) Transcript_23541:173-1426(+)